MTVVSGKVIGPRGQAAVGARVMLEGRGSVFAADAKDRGGLAVYHLELIHGSYRLTARHPQFGAFSGTVWLSSEPAVFDLYLDTDAVVSPAARRAKLSATLASTKPRTPLSPNGWLRRALKRVIPGPLRAALRRRFDRWVTPAPLEATPADAGTPAIRRLDFRSPAVRARCRPFGAVRGILTTPHGLQLSCAPGNNGGIEIPVDLDASTVNCLQLTVRDIPSGGDPVGWIAWIRADDEAEGLSAPFVKHFVPGVDSVTTYRLVLTPRRGWHGRIRALSIQPMQPQMELRSLAVQALSFEAVLATRGEDPTWVTVRDEIRACRCAPPPHQLTVRLRVPVGGAQVRLGFAVHDLSVGTPGLAVTFRAGIAGESTPLFERTLAPTECPADCGWQDAQVEVSAFAGREIALELATSQAGAGPADRCYALWMEPEVLPTHRVDPRPNVILISVDALRRDRVGCFAGRNDVTPHLDALAADGTRFSAAWATTRWTLGSHAAMLTGRDQIAFAPNTTEMRVPKDAPTLLTRFAAAGYACAGIVGGGYLEPAFGYGRGCRQYAWPPHDEVFARAGLWLESHTRAPFCLFLHTFEVHDVIYADDRVKAMYANPIRFEPFPPDDQAHLARRYEERVRIVDGRIGALIQRLKALEVYDQTVIVVVGDHGEGFGEHGVVGHVGEWWLWEETLAVPFLVKPAGDGAPGGEVAVPVSLVDVTPTILELAGLPVPGDFDGRSLAPAVHGAALESIPIFASIMGTTIGVRDGDWKLVAPCVTRPGRAALRFLLHDLAHDPLEQRNLITAQPAVADRLLALAREWTAKAHAGMRLLVRNGDRPVVVTGALEASDRLRFAVAAGLTADDELRIAPQQQSAEWRFALAPHEERLIVFDAAAGLRLHCAASDHESIKAWMIGPDGVVLGPGPLTLGEEVTFDQLYASGPPPSAPADCAFLLWHQDAHHAPRPSMPTEIPVDLHERLRALGYTD